MLSFPYYFNRSCTILKYYGILTRCTLQLQVIIKIAQIPGFGHHNHQLNIKHQTHLKLKLVITTKKWSKILIEHMRRFVDIFLDNRNPIRSLFWPLAVLSWFSPIAMPTWDDESLDSGILPCFCQTNAYDRFWSGWWTKSWIYKTFYFPRVDKKWGYRVNVTFLNFYSWLVFLQAMSQQQ